MHIHRYIEVPAPLDVTQALLSDQPPFDGERLGAFWRWHEELWMLEAHSFADGRMLWHGTCPALPKAAFLLSATLHDAVIATQVQIHLSLTLPDRGMSRFWQDRRRYRALTDGLDAALQTLRQQARQTVPAPVAATELPADPQALAAALQTTHPETVAAFTAMQALPGLQAVVHLDQRWQATEAGVFTPDVHQQVANLPSTVADYDLVYAGGGLGLLHAAVMACCYGYRVLLFDQGDVGCVHREWNISDRELRALTTIGLCAEAELEQVIMRRYRDGLVRFWPNQSAVRPAELHLPNVLNVAVDATGLLQLARRKLEAAGGIVLDRCAFKCIYVQAPGRIAVEVAREDGTSACYGARVLLDGMGATSPLALRRFAGQPFAGVCPTVGTVVEGLEHGTAPNQHHPDIGDILVSISDTQRDRQLIWEGFAGRGDELTVYVFYYDVLNKNTEHRTQNKRTSAQARKEHRTNAQAHEEHRTNAQAHEEHRTNAQAHEEHRTNAQAHEESRMQSRAPSTEHQEPSARNRQDIEDRIVQPRHSLLDLFEDYFRLLPTYKQPGPHVRHIKPVYGFIPARHTQRRQTVALLPGVLPIGDSSAQQSPLTFCGFGSHVRNLDRTTSLLDRALRRNLLRPEYLGQINAYQANVALNWVFSRFMQPWHAPHDVNRLQNIFARVLNEVGVDRAVRFFQDQMTWRDYGQIVNHTLAIYKPIIPTALTVLGPRDTARWAVDWLRFSAAAATATLGGMVGATMLDTLTDQVDRYAPGVAFRIAARRAEWRAMGWS